MASLSRAGLSPEIVLVNVRPWPLPLGEVPASGLDQIERAGRQHQQHLLGEAEAQALAAGLNVTARVAGVGEPAIEIVRVAQECRADQIAMGSRGMGALGSFFMGSVAQRVVHLAEVPVLLVK